MAANQQQQRPRHTIRAYGAPIIVPQNRDYGRWIAFPVMRRPIGWNSSLLTNRDGPPKTLETLPATRPWTEREDQYLFDASLRGDSIYMIAKTLNRGYEETTYRITAHSNPTFIESKLPEAWMRRYFTVLGELRRSGATETPWTAEEEEELMLFVINGNQWIDPTVFANDRTVEGMQHRMNYLTGPTEAQKSKFEALKRREARELSEFQERMSDEEWRDLGLTPPGRAEALGAETGWRRAAEEYGVMLVRRD